VNKKILIGLLAFFALLMILLITLGVKRDKVNSQVLRGDTASGLLMQARALEAKDKLWDAKKIYQRLISDYPNSGEVMNWQKKSEELNMRLLFSPTVTPGSALYEIKPGDTLVKIAKEFKTTPELIMKSNRMSADKLIPGRKIKVWTSPFTILVDKSQNLLLLKTNEEVFKTYTVSTGLNNSTPVGNFKITNKLLNPTWFKAGVVVPAGSPENILGTRWMGLDLAGYGIHGTTAPQSLGQQVTQGCVRMLNAEVEELYSIVPMGTEVTIVD
jgi:lipoprotein-anchoring transpeptidase ErfK/SrfK